LCNITLFSIENGQCYTMFIDITVTGSSFALSKSVLVSCLTSDDIYFVIRLLVCIISVISMESV